MADHVQDSLLAYVDGSLGPAERVEVERHVAVCAACRAELRSIERAHQALRSVPWPLAPAQTAERALLRATRRPTIREWLAVSPLGVRWAAGLVTVAAATLLILDRGGPPLPPNALGPAELRPVADTTARFLLVLHAPSSPLPTDSQSVQTRRRDYAAWGATMVRDPRFVTSSQLTREPSRLVRESRVLLADASPLWVASQQVQGYLVVRAGDIGEAAEIARQSPHVRYGGTITVRQIAVARQ